MDDWLIALIAAGGVLGGSALTGLITLLHGRLDRRAQQRDELRSALAGYGAALDRLTIQIDQTPHAPDSLEQWLTRQVSKWRNLDWVLGRISTAIFGRGTMRAIDALLTATNRLALIAPESVLVPMRSVGELIDRYDQGNAEWRAEWRKARDAIADAAREALDE